MTEDTAAPAELPPEANLRPIADDRIRYWVSWFLQRLFLLPACFLLYRVLNRLEIHGAENFDKVEGGSFLICPNHTSAWDGPSTGIFVASSLRRYFDPSIHWTVLADPVRMVFRPVQLFCIWMGIVPVDRKAGIEQFSLQDALRILTAGARRVALVIYPEGTRSPDGRLARKGKLGAGWFQKRSGLPVLPIYHIGLPGMPGPFRRFAIHVGEPMHFDHYKDAPDDPPTWNAITKEIMARLAEIEARVNPAPEGYVPVEKGGPRLRPKREP